ncbi:hypothetical protein E6O75_ATG05450 [Venturia nashicola]|uniref:Uncharacterized protein n=1 Tax=Venturia nashicola TaxID=86259 RepID=A0A4Z1P7N8_9PEZI|nr:hypothetical protein E6O75_ATG05450 [Venturia nashicola]
MTLTRLLLLGITASSLVFAAGQCSGAIGTVASLVSPIPAAQSFCTSKYPLPLVTITTTVGTSTISTTVATNTVTTTTATVTATTVVATNTVLTTLTIYQKRKRATISDNIKTKTTSSTLSTVTS